MICIDLCRPIEKFGSLYSHICELVVYYWSYINSFNALSTYMYDYCLPILLRVEELKKYIHKSGNSHKFSASQCRPNVTLRSHLPTYSGCERHGSSSIINITFNMWVSRSNLFLYCSSAKRKVGWYSCLADKKTEYSSWELDDLSQYMTGQIWEDKSTNCREPQI